MALRTLHAKRLDEKVVLPQSVGNNKEVLLDVVTQLLPYIGYPRTLNALRCLNEVLAA